uniref:Transmembrane protein n=1 Tax=Knipowitschia caucasica TaxID=637954 RepID=A0AAV2M248_KNICA
MEWVVGWGVGEGGGVGGVGGGGLFGGIIGNDFVVGFVGGGMGFVIGVVLCVGKMMVGGGVGVWVVCYREEDVRVDDMVGWGVFFRGMVW